MNSIELLNLYDKVLATGMPEEQARVFTRFLLEIVDDKLSPLKEDIARLEKSLK
jgi:hypothetical protein